MSFRIKIGSKLAASAMVAGLLIAGMVANQWISNGRILADMESVGREQTILNGIADAQIALTEEIGSRIARIQTATGESVRAIDTIAGRIREISAVATSIAAAVEEQSAATQEIVRNVAQAAVGTGAVTANVAGVAGAAEHTGAAASQVLASASELSRQSEHLGAEVERFLSTVRAA